MSLLSIQVKGSNDLRRMADALRKADREDLRKGLDRAIRKAATPTDRAIQESARNIQTTGFPRPPSATRRPFTAQLPPKHTREQIAKAVRADISTAGGDPRVSFRVREALLPKRLSGMPRKFDSGAKWRHPIPPNNRDVWVSQIAKPWFWPPIERHIKDFRAAIDAELDIVRQKLERA